MKIQDGLLGLFFFILGSMVLYAVRAFPNIPGQPVGPALFPGIIAVGLCITGALLILKGWKARAQSPLFAFDNWIDSPRHVTALCTLLTCVVFYIFTANALGFLLTSFLMLIALFKALHVGWRRTLTVALLATLLIHFAFYKLLRVPLPWGVLTPWAW